MTTRTSPHLTEASPYRGGSGARTTLDLPLLLALAQVPGIAALAVTDRPSGTLVYVGLRDMDAESIAYEKLTLAQSELGPDLAIELICVPLAEWETLAFSETARIYSF
jgi:hypothetical protein